MVTRSSETSVDLQPTTRLYNPALLCFPPAFTLVSCSAYSSTLKMKGICFSETSVDLQRTILVRRYIPTLLCFPPAFTLVSCSAYSSTLKMKGICSSETSVDLQSTTRRYNPDLARFPPAFTLVSCSAYSSTLKMEALCSSEKSVDFQRTIRRYIPEDSTLHNHRCEDLRSYVIYVAFLLFSRLHELLEFAIFKSEASTLNIKGAGSQQTLVLTYQIIRRHNPEGNDCCENPKYHCLQQMRKAA
jgi:hypothetical protein